jgi:hypothetical protein
LFSRVGIFAGGFSLDAATAVCSGENLDEIDILDLLSSLTDKSLVVADTAGDHVAVSIEHLALVFAVRGDHAGAATLEGYADAALQLSGYPREFTETTTCDRLTALLRETLAPDELARLLAEGAALTPEAAIALALAEA